MSTNASDAMTTNPGNTVASRETLAEFLRLIAHGTATSRVQLARATGMARSTVSAYVTALLELGYIEETTAESTLQRGRPAAALQLGPHAPKLLVIDITVRRVRAAIFNLGEQLLSRAERTIGILDVAVDEVVDAVAEMLASDLADAADRLALAVAAIPAPVNLVSGVVGRPSLDPSWEGSGFADRLSARLGVPCLVENDANLMALGEASGSSRAPAIYAHLTHGLGVGLINDAAEIHRGADGTAGDIGHLQRPDLPPHSCLCGRDACIGPYTSIDSIINDLGIAEIEPGSHASLSEIAELQKRYRDGDAATVQRVQQVSTAVGEMLAVFVDFYNPATLVIGGELTTLGDAVLSTVRTAVYENAIPAATGRLVISKAVGEDASLRGGARFGTQAVFVDGQYLAMDQVIG